MFSAAKEAFLQKLTYEHHASPHTISAYKIDISQFITFIENSKQAISKKQLLEFQKNLLSKYTGKTVHRKLSSIGQFVDYLAAEKWLSKKPNVQFEKIKIKKTLPKVLSYKKIQQIREKIHYKSTNKNRDILIIELLYGLGLRVSEVVGLNKNDIGSENIQIRGKGQKDRRLPINPNTQSAIATYIAELKPKEALITNKKGNRITRQGIQYILKQFADISPHQFRHSIATHLLENKMPLSHIQRLLGHKNLNTTQIYTQTSVKNTRKMLNITHPRMAA